MENLLDSEDVQYMLGALKALKVTSCRFSLGGRGEAAGGNGTQDKKMVMKTPPNCLRNV